MIDHLISYHLKNKKGFAFYRLANEMNCQFISGEISHFDGNKSGFVVQYFDSSTKNIILPERTLQDSLEELLLSISQEFTSQSEFELEPTEYKSTSKNDYNNGFDQIQNAIAIGSLKKAILSRLIVSDQRIEILDLFRNLISNYANAHISLIFTPESGLWMGATPETLVSEKNGNFSTMSLAGTKPTEATQWTNKEIEEQSIVTKSIVEQLEKNELKPIVSPLETISSGVVFHLRNLIKFKAKKEELPKIIEALHPTPAISGFPKKEAFEIIRKIENHKRELYCGIIGPLGIFNQTHLLVNLRCMKITQNQLILFAGGGITQQSQIEKEWEECSRKASSLSRFF